jgi:nitrogenase molybdenum-iron protein NifN
MESSNYVSTTNACKLCTPLGASLAFKGIADCVPMLHGSQGCATYMRRYIISHFREPMDIASSALGEKQAVFGGGPNLKKGILNVMKKYGPAVIGVATTCLTETIGDDVPSILDEFRKEFSDLPLPALVHAATPSYSGTHADGWREAVRATVDALVQERAPESGMVNVFPSLLSCEDTRHLKDIFRIFDLPAAILPDLSESLDGPALEDYEPIPSGGTPLSVIRGMSGASASLELGRTMAGMPTAGRVLEERFGVRRVSLGLPIGLRETDALCQALEEVSGRATPRELALERGRLVDALVDGHKYIFGKRAVVYGEEDLVVGLVSFLSEIGVRPVLAATGGRGKGFAAAIAEATRDILPEPCQAVEGVDFHDIAERAETLAPDLLVGHSKGYSYAKQWNVPLVRVGFPIHDRFGGQRLLHLGYRGAQGMLDRIINAVLEKTQNENPIGYGYL